jgi:ABC-type branched-subunit amino acid transport system substrate-binding protein
MRRKPAHKFLVPSDAIPKCCAPGNLLFGKVLSSANEIPRALRALGMTLLSSCICCLIFVAGCASTHPVIKFGLVAPFEGRYRPVGYDAIYAARLAVRERNAVGGVGDYRVELVAYDDGGDAQAATERARQLALDPQVVAVIGHYEIDTTRAAWDIYAREGLPLIAPVIPADSLPDVPCTECSFPAAFRTGPMSQAISDSINLDQVFVGDALPGTVFATGAPWPNDVQGTQQFIANYRAVSNGAEPGPYAWATYQAAQVLFEAMAHTPGNLTRRGVGAQLAAHGFDARGVWPTVPVYIYRASESGRPVLQR